ncbi:MAG: polysaccharide deacetylase family protein [Butyrivibrio sp.]
MDIWNGQNKAFTLSYDDGVESDKKFLDIINFYGLKCTFNLNSGKFGADDNWMCGDFLVKHVEEEEVPFLYAGHEIAVHGTKHLAPTSLSEEEFNKEFIEDRAALNRLCGTRPVGMAYAYGDYNSNVAQKLKSAGFLYGRTVEDSLSFDMQDNLLEFKPTCHHNNEKVFELLEEFVQNKDTKPQLFYLWGHSYEFDAENKWKHLERICEYISGRENIFYGTNRQVFGIK